MVITNGNYFALRILEKLLSKHGPAIRGVLLVSGDYKARHGFRALWEIGRKTALPYTIYKVFIFLTFRIVERCFTGSCYSVERFASALNIPIKTVVSVNSQAAKKWIEEKGADLIVSVSCPQMIKRDLLSIAKLGGINIHASLLPSYAGLAPYFWILSNNEENTGITAHYMTLQFDKGNILAQKSVRVQPRESAFCLFSRLSDEGKDILVEAIELAVECKSGEEQDGSKYSYHSNPHLSDYLKLRKSGHRLLRLAELLSVLIPLRRIPENEQKIL